jgi:striatin 1/3/4
LDVEPLYTFRSHTGPVLCLAMDNTGKHCFSGGLDSKIHCWTLPSANIDPYDSYDPSLLNQTLTGHTDAVWGLSMCHPRSQLLSVSADETVKLWSPSSKTPLLKTYASEEGRYHYIFLFNFFMFIFYDSVYSYKLSLSILK